jgi:hypothetical protein
MLIHLQPLAICLKQELPIYMYIAKAADVRDSAHPLSWWRRHEPELPSWGISSTQSLLGAAFISFS